MSHHFLRSPIHRCHRHAKLSTITPSFADNPCPERNSLQLHHHSSYKIAALRTFNMKTFCSILSLLLPFLQIIVLFPSNLTPSKLVR